MPRPRNPIPKIRRHSSGQARVTIEGTDYLLGAFGSPDAEEAYRRTIAQWLAKDGPFAPSDAPVTVTEVLAGYWLHAEKYYGYDRDPTRGDCCNLKSTIRILRDLYGHTSAGDFGPRDLRAVQAEMIRLGWCRNLINQQTGRIKQIFRWAVSEEMVAPGVWHALLSCPGLRRGKSEARETEPVKPVLVADIDAAKQHLRPAVAAMVDFALLTGCRPNEVCQLRPRDLDQADPRCWVFRPGHHKNQHHGHERPVLVGPRAQAVLSPFLDGCDPDEFVFSPKREEQRRNVERRAKRKSKPTPWAVARAELSLRGPRRRGPKERYTTASLRRAIKRACKAAGIPTFGPNRLRHTRATELRPHGLDVVATILGHTKLETTQIYSERNLAAAMDVVATVG